MEFKGLQMDLDSLDTKQLDPLQDSTIQDNRFSNIVNANDLSLNIIHILQCPSCKKIMPPPIYLCEDGHSICNTCKTRNFSCPKCNSAFTHVRNELAESIISKLLFKCPNWEDGCMFSSMGAVELDEHGKECSFGKIVCTIGNEVSCGESIPMTRYIDHLLGFHKILGVESSKAVISMSTSVSLGNGNWTFPPNYLKAFGRTFLCFVHASYNLIFLWICARGSNEDLSRFAGSIAIFDPEKKYLQTKWIGPIHSISTTPKDVFSTGACLTLMPETFMKIANIVKPSSSDIGKGPIIHWKCHYELFDRTVQLDPDAVESSESLADTNGEGEENEKENNNELGKI